MRRAVVLILVVAGGCDPSFEGSWTGDVVESGQLSVTGEVGADGTARVQHIAHAITRSGATVTVRKDGEDHVVSLPGCDFHARPSGASDELGVDPDETCTIEAEGHAFPMTLFGTVRLGGDERLFVALSGASIGDAQNGGATWSFEGIR